MAKATRKVGFACCEREEPEEATRMAAEAVIFCKKVWLVGCLWLVCGTIGWVVAFKANFPESHILCCRPDFVVNMIRKRKRFPVSINDIIWVNCDVAEKPQESEKVVLDRRLFQTLFLFQMGEIF